MIKRYEPMFGYVGNEIDSIDMKITNYGKYVIYSDVENEWEDISSAPTDGRHIQLYRPEIQFTGYYSDSGWVANAPGLPLIYPLPTHWKALSLPPK